MIAIIDGNHLFHRVRHIKALSKLRRYTGLHTGVVMGFVRSIHGLLVKFPSIDQVHVVFDGGHSERRKGWLSEYKVKPPMGEEDRERYEDDLGQLAILKNAILWRLGCRIYQFYGREGDDVIYQLCKMSGSEKVIVMSGDKDMLQLVDLETMIYDPLKEQVVTFENFKELTGINNPKQWVWYRSIIGDKSDNIPGVPGVGEKTIKPILADRWETSGDFLAAAEDGDFGKRAAKLATEESQDILCRNIELMRLDAEVFDDKERRVMEQTYVSETYVDLDLFRIFKSLSFQELCDQFDSWIAPFQRLK